MFWNKIFWKIARKAVLDDQVELSNHDDRQDSKCYFQRCLYYFLKWNSSLLYSFHKIGIRLRVRVTFKYKMKYCNQRNIYKRFIFLQCQKISEWEWHDLMKNNVKYSNETTNNEQIYYRSHDCVYNVFALLKQCNEAEFYNTWFCSCCK